MIIQKIFNFRLNLILGSILVFTFILILTLSCSKKPEVVKIGMAGPLTGSQAKMGNDILNGVRLAVEEWNNKGGVLGKKTEIISRDDGAQESQAPIVASELVNEGVIGVIGHFNSGCSIPASDVYKKANIPMITPSSTNPYLTEKGYLNVFRICGRDDAQGSVAAKFVSKVLKFTKIAVLHDKTAYGQGLSDAFKDASSKLGIEVVLYEGFDNKERNFRDIITKVIEKKPQLYYFGGIYDQAGPLLLQAKEAGLKAIFMSGDGTFDQEFLRTAGTSADSSFLTFADPYTSEKAHSFSEKYKSKFGEIGPYSIYAYDATNVLLSSIEKSKSTDGKIISEIIHNSEFDVTIGKVKYDPKGDLLNSPFKIWIVKNGKFEIF